MALQMQTPIQLKNGLTIDSAYARVGVVEPINGKNVNAHLIVYKDKVAYQSGIEPIKGIEFNGLVDFLILEYNREIDGSDTLDIAHNAFIVKLAEQDIIAIKDL